MDSFPERQYSMQETRITVAHSPDSDDAFMFFGLASNNVDTGGIIVEQVLSDIETLNRMAFEGKYKVTAVSFHAYAHLADKYTLLAHGASMGDNYGPIVVARQDGGPTGVKGSRIAIPGELTTAYLALGSMSRISSSWWCRLTRSSRPSSMARRRRAS